MMRRLLRYGVLCFCIIPPSVFADVATSPEALIGAYLDSHNRHDLSSELAFYADDATFVLSQGRGEVHGRDAIGSLLQFDVAAGSSISVSPSGIHMAGQEIVVDMRPAVERSLIFTAIGMPFMRSTATPDAFHIRDGKIALTRQPEFTQACAAIVGDAMQTFAKWLKPMRPNIYTELYPKDKLDIRPGIVSIWADSIAQWRKDSGWQPDPAGLAACLQPATDRTQLPSSLPRPVFPMSAAAHRQFRDAEFDLRDTNHDGVLDISEIAAALLRETGDQSPERIKRAMRVNCGFDTMACTKAQYDAQGDAEFKRVDRNDDGFITREELDAAGGTMHLEAP